MTIDLFSGPAPASEQLDFLNQLINEINGELNPLLDDSIIPVTFFGAIAGAANNTVPFQEAADFGGPIYVPVGLWNVDQITCSVPIQWILADGAVVKLRSFVPGASGQAASKVFHFTSGATGASITGGVINGNRDAATISSPDQLYGGVFSAADNFKLHQVTFEECVAAGFWLQGDNNIVSDVIVHACGKGSIIQGSSNLTITNLLEYDISVDGLEVYQHANEWRSSAGLTASNWTVTNFQLLDFHPDITDLEPKPTGVALEQLNNCTFTNFVISGYSGTSSTGLSTVLSADCCNGLVINGFVGNGGYTTGIISNSNINMRLSNFFLDGEYVDGVTEGLYLTNSGLTRESNGGTIASNCRLNTTTQGFQAADGLVTRFGGGAGILILADDVLFTNVRSLANLAYGISCRKTSQNTSFTQTVKQGGAALRFVACQARFNGYNGIVWDDVISVVVLDCDLRDNGQDVAQFTSLRAGIGSAANPASTRAEIVNCRLGDGQSGIAIANGASFVPGTTDADDRFTVFFPLGTSIEVGQWLTFTNATGSGDITAKVVDMSTLPSVVVEAASTQTFSATGNTTALTGTLSSSGTTVTGAGTLFTTELQGPTVIRADGEYRRVVKVVSNTSLLIDSAFTAPLSADAAVKVIVAIAGISSQQYGVYLGAATVGPVNTQNNDYTGIVTAPMNPGNYTCWGPNAEVIVATAVAGVSLNTGGAATDLITSLPAGWVPKAARGIITTAVAGVNSTTLTLTFEDGGGTVATVGTFTSPTALNATVKGNAIPASVADSVFDATSKVTCTLSGGGDNTPSAGKVRVEAMIIAPAFFANLS